MFMNIFTERAIIDCSERLRKKAAGDVLFQDKEIQ
jgi:hypothetical protein